MEELLRNAVLGWRRYAEGGKLAVLLFGCLLFLWFCYRGERNAQRRQLLLFGTLGALLAVFPPTAALLMAYQTKFYDYVWIWSLVPVTLLIAYGGTNAFCEGAVRYCDGKKWKFAVWTAACLAVLALCGNLGGNGWESEKEAYQAEKAAALLDDVTENGKNKDICLWAPREIMAYARQIDGSVKLPYGRNMWEPALNAYSYDTYDEETRALYRWMEALSGEPADALAADALAADALPERSAAECAETAVRLGVNAVLLPQTAPEEEKQAFERAWEAAGFDGEAHLLDGYLLYSR